MVHVLKLSWVCNNAQFSQITLAVLTLRFTNSKLKNQKKNGNIKSNTPNYRNYPAKPKSVWYLCGIINNIIMKEIIQMDPIFVTF